MEHHLYASSHNVTQHNHSTGDPRSDFIWAVSYSKAKMLLSLLIKLHNLVMGIHAGTRFVISIISGYSQRAGLVLNMVRSAILPVR